MLNRALRGPEALSAAMLAAAMMAADCAAAQENKDLQQIERDLRDAKAAAKSLGERGQALQTELDILRERLVAAASDAQNAEQELTSESRFSPAWKRRSGSRLPIWRVNARRPP